MLAVPDTCAQEASRARHRRPAHLTLHKPRNAQTAHEQCVVSERPGGASYISEQQCHATGA